MNRVSTYKHYLLDLVPIIMENATFAIEKQKKNHNDFIDGQIFAYYDVLSVMQQQAVAFGIDLKEIGLQELEIEKYAIS